MGGRAHSGAHFIGRARRWFRRRSQRVRSALSQETRARSHFSANSNSISDSSSNFNSASNSRKQRQFSQKREKPKIEKGIVEVEIEEEGEEEEEEHHQQQQQQQHEKEKEEEEQHDLASEQPVEFEELGIAGLRLIRVPFRWKMAGFDTYKKVLHFSPSYFLFVAFLKCYPFFVVKLGSLWFSPVGFDCPIFAVRHVCLFVGSFVFVFAKFIR